MLATSVEALYGSSSPVIQLNPSNFKSKVDICYFDKTGTLTSDDMEFSEVGLTERLELETKMTKVSS